LLFPPRFKDLKTLGGSKNQGCNSRKNMLPTEGVMTMLFVPWIGMGADLPSLQPGVKQGQFAATARLEQILYAFQQSLVSPFFSPSYG